MSYNAARSELKKRLPEYVSMITKPDRKAGKNMYVCPLCASGTHSGRNSNGAFSIKADGETWHCFSCQKGGDIFDLIGEYENIDSHTEQLKRAGQLFKTDIAADTGSGSTQPARQDQRQQPAAKPEKKPQRGQFSEYIAACAAAAEKTDYFYRRGFTLDTVKRFNLGFDESKGAIVIPYDRQNSYYITRSTTGKEFRKPPADQAGAEPVYNGAAMYSGQPCFICESQLDAISIMQAGGTAAAIGGAGIQKLINQVQEKRPAAALILCFDNDTAGQKTTEAAAEGLKGLNVPHVIAQFALDQYSGERKDANDLLTANENQLRQDVRDNMKRAFRKAAFVPYNVKQYLESGTYDSDIEYFKRYKDRKTGFKNIDKYLTLYPGMAALGGSASLGKTTFAVNLADNLSMMGETVLYFVLEQETIEIVTKLEARKLFYLEPESPIKNIDIKNGAKSEALHAARGLLSVSAERFNIVRCNFTTTAEDIRDYVEAFIKRTGIRPVVFIDYLQLISPPDDYRGDTRTATDHILKVIKTMQLDNELFVVLISSFNRNSYILPVSMEAFKETGMIDYTCDYVWGLQLSILEASGFYVKEGKNGGQRETTINAKRDAIYEASIKNPKEVEFVSLKSRHGRQCYKCFFTYNMQFDSFIEDFNSEFDPDRRTPAGFTRIRPEEDTENPFTGITQF